jgi:rhomboid protease GluP
MSNTRRIWEIPSGMAQLLLGANVLIFALCWSRSGAATISTDILFGYGAMYSQALERHEYWRLIAYGFLHANPVHLFGNMLCLMLWGGLLERRVQALYFTLIYVCGLIVAAIVSNIAHQGPYLAVGASGAISAVLGALLSLQILGKINLPWNFFVINIGLNVVIAASASQIDWQAHLGGFIAGVIGCACLDLVEKALVGLLRCKFPEFVKMNLFLAFAVVAVYWSSQRRFGFAEPWVLLLVFAIAGMLVIKVLDLVLSMKKGLAVIVFVFAVANAVMVLLIGSMLSQQVLLFCAAGGRSTIAGKACGNIDVVIDLAALGGFAFSLLLYWPQFARGFADVGFVAASLRGERGRRWGI